MSQPSGTRTATRRTLSAAAAAIALAGAAAMLSGSPASASPGPPWASSSTLQSALRGDLSHYLATRHKAEHISAVSLRVTYPGTTPAINLAAGTTRYDGGPPVSTSALWQVGSNTKAFTAVILLQLEAEGKLSVNDPIGTWLPQYPAWRDVTIKRLLDMTSRIPDYALQPAFDTTIAQDPGTRFTAAQLVSYAAGAPLHLRGLCYAPYTCPGADTTRIPAGYFFEPGAPPLLGHAMPRLAITWTQAAGGILSPLASMTTWERALYQGQLLPPAQQHQLESLISETTGKPITTTTTADPNGYALGVTQVTDKPLGTVWWYRGGTLGYRFEHFYFPRSGNNQDDLFNTAISIYQTLQKAH